MTLLFLGDFTAAASIFEDIQNQDLQTFWRHDFQNWRPNASLHLPELECNHNAVVTNLCIAIGLVPKENYNPWEIVMVRNWLLEKLFKSEHGATHSASKWTLRNLFDEAPDQRGQHSANWQVNRFGMTFVRISSTDVLAGNKLEDDVFVLDSEIQVAVFDRFQSSLNGALSVYGLVLRCEIDRDVSPSSIHPAQSMTMEQAVIFCNWLSAQCQRNPSYRYSDGAWYLISNSNGYRLPTITESKYFSKAGTKNEFFFGTEKSFEQVRNYASCVYTTRSPFHMRSSPVGSYVPNRFGLFDTLGNVSEWSWNELYEDLRNIPYPHFGGCYSSRIESLARNRERKNPFQDSNTIGFRVLFTATK